jgi:hypothetical protein
MKLYKILLINLIVISKIYGQWSELTGLNTTQSIISLCSDFNGNIYAAGSFTNLANKKYVAKFDGTRWSELGGSNSLGANLNIHSLISDSTGNIYAAGSFTNSANNKYVAKFDGTKWSELGAGANGLNVDATIYSICIDLTGNIYAAGNFRNLKDKHYVAKFNGNGWFEIGTSALNNSLNANAPIYKICSDSKGNIYAAGSFTNSANNKYVAKFDGTKWSELGGSNSLGSGLDNINSLISDSKGNIYANIFKYIGVGGKAYIAKFDGTDWKELGGINSLVVSNINTIFIDSKDNIYAAVNNIVGSEYKSYIVMFNGSNWSILGGGSDPFKGISSVNVLSTDSDGNLYAANKFVAKLSKNQSNLKQPLKNNLFSLYTNPIENKIILTAADELYGMDYFIYDKSGKLIVSDKIKSEITNINIANLSNGVYILTIKNKFSQSFCVSNK